MTHPLNYLLGCAGWRAASHEREDHLQRWPAAAAPSPGRQTRPVNTHSQRGKKSNVDAAVRRFLHCEYNVHSSPSHSTPWESCDRGISWWCTKKKGVILFMWHFRFQTLKKLTLLNQKHTISAVPALTSWCCRRSAWETWPCKADLD